MVEHFRITNSFALYFLLDMCVCACVRVSACSLFFRNFSFCSSVFSILASVHNPCTFIHDNGATNSHSEATHIHNNELLFLRWPHGMLSPSLQWTVHSDCIICAFGGCSSQQACVQKCIWIKLFCACNRILHDKRTTMRSVLRLFYSTRALAAN